MDDPALWFLFESNKLLVKIIDNIAYIPTFEEVTILINNLENKYSIGEIRGYSCFTARYKVETELPDGFAFKELRHLLGKIDENLFQIAGRGIQILDWADTHKYCGFCGTPTNIKDDEFARVCPACGHMCFPRISPAIIVAITKENKILLARNKNFRNFYSVIAGFVEPGETLEGCVKREVKEEIGLEVKNIKYFGSQPWPFPNTLMIGFTAEYARGEIVIDENELAEADWYTVHNLPQVPNNTSIAGQLINWFIENNN